MIDSFFYWVLSVYFNIRHTTSCHIQIVHTRTHSFKNPRSMQIFSLTHWITGSYRSGSSHTIIITYQFVSRCIVPVLCYCSAIVVHIIIRFCFHLISSSISDLDQIVCVCVCVCMIVFNTINLSAVVIMQYSSMPCTTV